MTRPPKLLLLLCLAVAMVPVLSCGSRHDSDEKYCMISANLQVPYWKEAGAGFLQAASDLKVRAQVSGPETYDLQAEQRELQRVIKLKPSGILISPADARLMKADIDAAITAGIPVVTLDSDAPDSKRLFFIGTDNYNAGLIGGRRAVQELHSKGNVVVFTMPEQANLEERLRGYRDAFADHPEIKIVGVVDIRGDPRIAFDTTTDILSKKEKVDGFICLEALAGKEVAAVLTNQGVKGKVVIAMDTDPDTLDAVRKGVIAATISQKPYTMGFVGLKMLDDLFHHKPPNLAADWAKDGFAPIPSFVDTGRALIDKTNVDAFLEAKKSATSAPK